MKFTATTNSQTVTDDLRKQLDELERTSKALRVAAFDAVAIIKRRVQQEGRRTDGAILTSRSARKTGRYSRAWGKKRQERGRRIDQVDFTDKGDLMRNFDILGSSGDTVTIGFSSDVEAQKADGLEKLFGETFSLSDKEIVRVVNSATKHIQKLFKK